jgi:hypothetical protein
LEMQRERRVIAAATAESAAKRASVSWANEEELFLSKRTH